MIIVANVLQCVLNFLIDNRKDDDKDKVWRCMCDTYFRTYPELMRHFYSQIEENDDQHPLEDASFCPYWSLAEEDHGTMCTVRSHWFPSYASLKHHLVRCHHKTIKKKTKWDLAKKCVTCKKTHSNWTITIKLAAKGVTCGQKNDKQRKCKGGYWVKGTAAHPLLSHEKQSIRNCFYTTAELKMMYAGMRGIAPPKPSGDAASLLNQGGCDNGGGHIGDDAEIDNNNIGVHMNNGDGNVGDEVNINGNNGAGMRINNGVGVRINNGVGMGIDNVEDAGGNNETAVGTFLRDLKLGQYIERFKTEKIGMEEIALLNNDWLLELGITAVGDRLKLLCAIEKLQG